MKQIPTKPNLRRDALAALGLLLLGLLVWSVAYQFARPAYIDIGGPYDAPYLVNYLNREGGGEDGQATYRWADGYSAIHFPGIGIAPAQVSLQISAPQRVGGLPLTVYVNGVATQQLTVTQVSANYDIAIPANLLAAGGDGAGAGDLVLFLQGEAAPISRSDARSVAFQADFARLSFGGGFVTPAPLQILWLGLALLLLYALVRRVADWRWAVGVTVGFIVATAGVLMLARLVLTVYTVRLVAVLVLAHLALWLCVWLASIGFQRGGIAASAWLGRGLAVLFVVGFLLKLGGLYHPFSFVVDEQFHLAKIEQIAHGDFWQFYFSPELSLSVMPEGDWKTRAIIPYSPFFYMVSAGLAQLPIPTNLALYFIAALLDASRVYLLAFIALRFGWSVRAAWFAAAVATFTPASFLLQQWGNYPTALSLWFTLLFVALLVGAWPQMKRRALLWLTLLLAVTFVSYTVTAVMLGVTLLGFIILGALFQGRQTTTWGIVAPTTLAQPRLPSPYLKLLLVTITAAVLAMLAFYGQYLIILIRDTIPNLASTIGDSGSLKPTPQTWGEYLALSADTMWRYQLWGVYLLGIVGLICLFAARKGNVGAQFIAPEVVGSKGMISYTPTLALLAAFLLTGLLFVCANYFVDMAMKQYWWALPFIALSGGWLLDYVWQRFGRRVGMVVAALSLIVLAVGSLWLWVFRLLIHNRLGYGKRRFAKRAACPLSARCGGGAISAWLQGEGCAAGVPSRDQRCGGRGG